MDDPFRRTAFGAAIFYKDPLAALHELPGGRRQQRDAVFLLFDFFRNADGHRRHLRASKDCFLRGQVPQYRGEAYEANTSAGRRSAWRVACSNARAMARTSRSAPGRPTICNPTGSPSAENPQGTLIAGEPKQLTA